MADDERTHQPGYPQLVGPRWKPGESGNKAGVSKYLQDVRKAIQRQEPPAEVCTVIAAMKRDALSGTKAAPAAAKVYLAYTVGETQHLPDERLEKLVEERLEALVSEAERRRQVQ